MWLDIVSNLRKILIIGATSAMAEHCARLWVQKPVDLILVGRSALNIERIAADLRERSPQSTIRVMLATSAEFCDPVAIDSLIHRITESSGPIDIALIAHGAYPEQQDCQENLTLCRDTLLINGVSPVLHAEALVKRMEKAKKGTLAIISSIAGDRGRKANYVYGSAKGLITRYAQGLQHRFAGTNIKVVLIKPGPTDTPMAQNYKKKGYVRLASVEFVAPEIVKAIERGQLETYIPGRWRFIMRVLQHCPDFLFHKINI